MVFGQNLAESYRRQDGDGDLPFAQDPSISGQFPRQWELRAIRREALLEEITSGKLRRLLSRNQLPDCADVKVGGSVFFYKTGGRAGAPRWRAPAAIADAGESRCTVMFRGQTFKVGRFRARWQVGPGMWVRWNGTMPRALWMVCGDSLCRRSVRGASVGFSRWLGMGGLSDDYWFTEGGWRLGIFSPPRLPGGQRPRLPLSRFERDPLLSFDENCAELRAPEATHGGYDELNGDELYQLGSRGAVLKTGSCQ